MFSSDDELLDTDEVRQQEDWLKYNQLLNENDDKADVRDGIAETKGKRMRASGEDLSKLRMAPREQNTKIFRMLKDMRSYLDKEFKRKEAARV